MILWKWLALAAGGLAILAISRRTLSRPRAHGFYRTWAWLAIFALFLLNVDFWFVDPFTPRQLLAWTLLVLSLVLIAAGALTLRRAGRPDASRQDESLIGLEKTTRLVTTGIYRYIRHPFYASLLALAWGIYCKQFSWPALALALLASGFLLVTALLEEGENLRFFGAEYGAYMRLTKRFIPHLF
jgi:protein-S-isoprenylcysteine O-methyltransferase Ste14